MSSVDKLSIRPKLDAAEKAGLYTVFVAGEQVSEWQGTYKGSRIELKGASTALDAAREIARVSGPRRAVRTKIHSQYSQIELLTGRVNLEDIYIVLPLMKEIKKESLPELRDPRDSQDRSGAESEEREREQLLRSSIRRWEEAITREVIEHQSCQIEDVFKEVPRFVVVGPPGSGKTSLVGYLAWRMTDSMNPLLCQGKQVIPVPVRLRQWELEAGSESLSLLAFLAKQYENLPMPPDAQLWRQWLERSEAMLLLDGLDEVSLDFVITVGETVAEFPHCPMVITCRTITRERLNAVAKGIPIFTPSAFDEEQRNEYIDRYPGQNIDRSSLKAELQRSDFDLLAANPLLLSILCFVADAKPHIPLPETRSQLYEAAVKKVLKLPRRVSVGYPKMESEQDTKRDTEPEMDTKREVIEELALTMLQQSKRRTVFSQEELHPCLTRIFEEEMGYKRAMTDALLNDLRNNSRILQGMEGEDYSFIHPTFQEFLAACALARQARKAGLDGGIVNGWGKREWTEAFDKIDRAFKEAEYNRENAGVKLTHAERVLALLDHKAWLSEWQEVFLFLAGTLQNPIALLSLLSDEYVSRDDLFRHRLALSALCLAEINPALW